jgi:hypothetical protein
VYVHIQIIFTSTMDDSNKTESDEDQSNKTTHCASLIQICSNQVSMRCGDDPHVENLHVMLHHVHFAVIESTTLRKRLFPRRLYTSGVLGEVLS